MHAHVKQSPSTSRATRPAISRTTPAPPIQAKRGNCACGGSCPRCKESAIQPKLRVSEPGDALEREADRAAEHVMRMPAPDGAAETLTPSAPSISRAAASGASEVSGASPAVHEALHSSGQPLDAATRTFFEPRFGRDFGRVRVHTDARAAESARSVNAVAYTVGNDIVFARGAYAPATTAGRALLAHELAHTIQQDGNAAMLQRQVPDPNAYLDRFFRDTSGGGSTTFRETVEAAPQVQADDRVTGRVRRREIAPATDTAPEEVIHDTEVEVVFNPNTTPCQIEVPYRLDFVAQQTANASWTCQDPPSSQTVTNVSQERLDEIATEYVDALNEGLNGWYTLRMDGCTHRCAGQDIPVVVNVERTSVNPHRRIAVVNRGGRADAGTICARDFNADTNVHEGGHQVLGVGDEYRESSAAVRTSVPRWGRDERVRTDLTYMGGHHEYGRFAMYHTRHFRFAQVFLEAVMQGAGCDVAMSPVTRTVPDFMLSLNLGSSSTPVGWSTITVGGGLDAGIPLTRGRGLELLLGLHGTFIDMPSDYREALLLGARAGLRAQTNPADWSFVSTLFLEGGTSLRWGGLFDTPLSVAGYGEVGLNIGLTTPMLIGGFQYILMLEGALGTEFPGDAHEELERVVSDDRNALEWARLGVILGARF